MRKVSMKRMRGQSLVEVVVGSTLVLMPMFMFGVDLITLVITATINRRISYEAARAASFQNDSMHARQAAQRMLNGLSTSSIIQKLSLESIEYSSDEVSLRTKMKIKCPAPFPFFAETELLADSRVHISAKPADL